MPPVSTAGIRIGLSSSRKERGESRPAPHSLAQGFRLSKDDGFVRNQEFTLSVVPAKAGIQGKQAILDPGLRRGDGLDGFLRVHQRGESSL
jgi:hypothetical protein